MILKPFEVAHTAESLNRLAGTLNDLGDGVRIVMEHTGRYYESVAQFLHGAGFFVSALNPLLIKEYGDGRLRGVKTDKTDAVKIARFALDNWEELRQYTPMDTIRYQLKTLNRQYQLASKNRTACANNLVALLEQSFPGIRSLFDSPVRSDGSQKWVDFVDTFWHLDCVAGLNLNTLPSAIAKGVAGTAITSAKRRQLRSTPTPASVLHWFPNPIPQSSWSGKPLLSSMLFPAPSRSTVPR